MSRFDRYMKRKRKRKYKRLRKLRKARDMASKYTKNKILLSRVFNYVKYDETDNRLFTSGLAKYIFENQNSIIGIRPPKPPSQN